MNRFRKIPAFAVQSLAAGVVAAICLTWFQGTLEPHVQAEPRRITPQEPDQHFKSGGRLSEAVLQELLTVVKRIDERLERIEKSAEQLAGGTRMPAARVDSEVNPPTTAPPIQVRRSR